MNRYLLIAAFALLLAVAAKVSSQVMRQNGLPPPETSIAIIAQGTSNTYQLQVVEVADEQGVNQPVLQLTR